MMIKKIVANYSLTAHANIENALAEFRKLRRKIPVLNGNPGDGGLSLDADVIEEQLKTAREAIGVLAFNDAD